MTEMFVALLCTLYDAGSTFPANVLAFFTLKAICSLRVPTINIIVCFTFNPIF
jgi:hypothetical protein